MKDPTAPGQSRHSVRYCLGKTSHSLLCALLFALCAAGSAQDAGKLESALGALQQLDYAGAAEILQRLADGGDARAQTALATLLESGAAGDTDPSTPLELLRRAAAQGLPEAILELGNRHYRGDGMPLDLVAAVSWWRRAAERGSARAAFNLGLAYAKGIGVAIDDEQARSWFTEAANGGVAGAWFALGVTQLRAASGSSEYAAACTSFLNAANADLVSAQYNLGAMYELGIACRSNRERALQWYRRAAAAGMPGAIAALTRMHAGVAAGSDNRKRFHEPAWVDAQSPDHYTVQVANGASKTAIIDILLKFDDTLDRVCVPVFTNGAQHYLALIGSFPQYVDALQILNTLTPELARQKPWIRRFRSIQGIAVR
jgi:TPR repeat protein